MAQNWINCLESNHTYPTLTYRPEEIQIQKKTREMSTDNLLKAVAGEQTLCYITVTKRAIGFVLGVLSAMEVEGV